MNVTKCPYEIVHEDNDILVVYKKRDVFTVATVDKKTFTHNLYHYLKRYLEKKSERPYVVHRLDYETSGLLVFAKNETTLKKLKAAFLERKVLREYEAVIREYPGIGKSYHVEQSLDTETKNVSLSEDPGEGKTAVTDILVTNETGIGSACRVNISTGRRNQIRLAFASLGLTLIGDRRYAHDEAKRMYLNAYHLAFPEDLGLKKSDFRVSPLWITESEMLEKV